MIGRERLTEMHQAWQNAKYRYDMATATVRGAELELIKTEARFHGAVEMLAGRNATWTFEPEKGIVIHSQGESATPSEAPDIEAATRMAATDMANGSGSNGKGGPEMELRSTDDHGNVTAITLPRNAARRKRVMRQLAAQGLPSPVVIKGGAKL